jgi:hypothetical protein
MFWPALLIGISVVIIEGVCFTSIRNTISSRAGLVLFSVTVLLVVLVPLYSAWKDGQVEVLP